jgi:uncharacterized membrane protein
MWSIRELKEAAKHSLNGSYWLAFAVCLVGGMLSGGINGVGSFGSGGFNPQGLSDMKGVETIIFFIVIFMVFFMFALMLGMAYTAFVGNPVLVGKSSYFIQNGLNGEGKFSLLFSVFKKGQYLSVVKTMIIKDLFVILWTLLFIVPGIIKSYSWRMVPYILAENPNMNYKDALNLSEGMTDGEKLNMFVMDLSFIGWWILGVLACCGIGAWFVLPYYEATWAQFYFVMRRKVGLAFEGGIYEES